MDNRLVALGKVKCHIAGIEEVIGEPFLDDMLLVSCADDEVVETVIAVLLHDVPQDRHAADFNHGLRLFFRLF